VLGAITAVVWVGADGVAISLHPACSGALGTHLIADSREAQLAAGGGRRVADRGMGGGIVIAQSATFRVGDWVELLDDLPGRPVLKAGTRGVVVVADLPFGACTVEFATRGGASFRQVRAVHLRRVPRPWRAP